MNGAAGRLPIVVLISGSGSNLRAIAEQARSGELPVEIRAVISDRPGAAGLAWAATAGIATLALLPRDFPDRAAFDRALADAVQRYEPGLVVLAGFMRILGAEFVAWTVVLVYIGAVVVLFLFGLMITRAPLKRDPIALDHKRRWPAALVAAAVFGLMAYATTASFGWARGASPQPASTADLGDRLFQDFVIPFEAVSFVLLAALIGGIVLARKDPRE